MRRILLSILLVICFLTLSSLSFSPKAMASPHNPSPTTITVDGTVAWTDTGIDVTSSQSMHITASGLVYMSPGSAGQPPDGVSSCTADSSFVAPGLHCWSMIGKIGTGTPFQAGSNVTLPASASGRLFLGVNDNNFSDNSGSWTATVTITQPGQTTITVDGTQPSPHAWIPVFINSSVNIVASGVIYVNNGTSPYGPDGNPSCTAPSGFVAPGLHCWSLVGKIGSNGTPFQLGSSGTFTFTGPTNTSSQTGQLYLSINDSIFSDNSGSWQVTLGIIQTNNSVWGGYSIAFPNPQPSQILSVQGSWHVPAISCYDNNNKPIKNRMAVWVGLGGIDTSLEQIGTFGKCPGGSPDKPVYKAFYRTPAVSEFDLTQKVLAGDSMRADVTDQSHGYVVLRIFDDTQGWNKAFIFSGNNSNTPDSAEWITEDEAGGTFPQFSFVHFTNCYSSSSSSNPIGNGFGLTQDSIVNRGKSQAAAGSIFSDGTEFEIFWKNF